MHSTAPVISITTFDRPHYAAESIKSLLAALGSGPSFDIHVRDDASTDERMIALLEDLRIAAGQRITVSNLRGHHGGVNLNNFRRLQDLPVELSREGAFAYLSDDDVLYSSAFVGALLELQAMMEADESVFCGSLFHSQNPAHEVLGEYRSDFLIKSVVGGCSILLRIGDLNRAFRHFEQEICRDALGWDWALARYAQHESRSIICTRKSFVEHIGKYGVNSTPACYDRAADFSQ